MGCFKANLTQLDFNRDISNKFAQSAEAVEYTNCTSAKE